ncbi:MAG: translocation/assembly module TamB domain-containing protein [Pseudomonadota bacterium]
MRRALTISAGAIGLLIVSVSLIAAFLFQTSPGRRLIADIAEDRVTAALGGEASIGSIGGAPPSLIVLENITLTDDTAPWLTVDRAELQWRPLSLIGGKFRVDLIKVDGAHLLASPPAKPDGEDEDGSVWPSAPEALPYVDLTALAIRDFKMSLGGLEAQVHGDGALSMGGRKIDARFTAKNNTGADTVDATILLDPAAKRALVDISIEGAENGVIATLVRTQGLVRIAINGDAPSDEAEIIIDAKVGAFGEANGTLTANLEDFSSAAITLVGAPGPAIAAPAIGDNVELDMHFDAKPRGGVITLTSLALAAGTANGAASWESDRRGVKTAQATAKLALAETFEPSLQEITGSTIEVDTALERTRDLYAVSGAATGEAFSVLLENGETDLKTRLSGSLSAALKGSETITPLLKDGLQADASITVVSDERVAAEGLFVSLADDTTFAGDAFYSLTDNTASIDGALHIAASAISMLHEPIALDGPVTGTVEGQGALDNFTLETTLKAPASQYNGAPAPALTANAAFAGLPARPNGDIAISADNGDGAFKAEIRTQKSGRISLPMLRYRSALFSLEGTGAVSADRQDAEIDLVYRGEKDAAPWPGLIIEGDATVKGAAALSGGETNVALEAPTLRIGTLALRGLKAQANGPSDAIDVTAALASLTSGAHAANDITAAATLDLEKGVEVTATVFSGTVDSVDLQLRKPTVVTISDGATTVKGLSLQWNDDGAIDLDADLTPTRWRADARLDGVAIPETDGLVNGSITIDTDETRMGSGVFALSSGIPGGATSKIDGAMDWDGKTLRLKSMDKAAASSPLAIDFTAPFRLDRNGGLSIDTGGDMTGTISYDGALAAITPLMPGPVQSLEGLLKASFDIGGSLAAPQIAGAAALTEGAYTEPQSGLSITGVTVNAKADVADGGAILRFEGGAPGDEGKSALSIDGDAAIGEASAIDITIALNDAVFSQNPVGFVRASGAIRVEGSFDDITASGDIVIDELNAEIIAPAQTGLAPIRIVNADAPDVTAPPTSEIKYDIKIVADDRIFVRGRGLESEWRTALDIESQRETPLVVGKVELRRGSLDFSGRRFDLTDGEIEFDRLAANNPIVTLRAEHDTNDVKAIIAVSGRAQSPEVTLTSEPVRPAEDVMGLVLFGKPASELSAVESLQTANAIAQLGGIGLFGGGGGFTNGLRNATGLDMLNIDVDPEKGGASLTVGKYVADGVFVSATQDADGQGGSVRVEYEVTGNIVVETELEQNGEQTASANWKKDF